mmetsp:Transcript_50104/g.85799  ORF Transcript_50104/g.85799 Transcript_50104/m.85799 type:complete len:179 (-) Transcript_50104:197-733(-)
MSRCIKKVIENEKNTSSSFDAIIMTRLDVINGISTVQPLQSWLALALGEFDLVAQKKKTGLIDDRFFFGRRDAVVRFESIFASFSTLYTPITNSPERMLFLFAKRNLQGLLIGPIPRYISFDSFEVNDSKYSLKFKREMAAQLGKSSGPLARGEEAKQRACSHIKTPLAHNKCIGLAS